MCFGRALRSVLATKKKTNKKITCGNTQRLQCTQWVRLKAIPQTLSMKVGEANALKPVSATFLRISHTHS